MDVVGLTMLEDRSLGPRDGRACELRYIIGRSFM